MRGSEKVSMLVSSVVSSSVVPGPTSFEPKPAERLPTGDVVVSLTGARRRVATLQRAQFVRRTVAVRFPVAATAVGDTVPDRPADSVTPSFCNP